MGAASSLAHTYRYAFASDLFPQEAGVGLRLATSGGQEPNPYFFRARLAHPREIADLHHLLTLLREWLTASGQPLPLDARPILQSIKGAGKAASLARALTQLPDAPNPAVRNQVYAAALHARITRARRWMEREASH